MVAKAESIEDLDILEHTLERSDISTKLSLVMVDLPVVEAARQVLERT